MAARDLISIVPFAITVQLRRLQCFASSSTPFPNHSILH